MSTLESRRLTSGFAVLLVIGSLLCCVGSASAAAGDLDPTFGNGGFSQIAVGTVDTKYDDLALAAGGRILVSGSTALLPRGMSIAAYNASGSLDTTFNPPFGMRALSSGTGDTYSGLTALQSDGKVLLAGDSYNGATEGVQIDRLSANGVVESLFAGVGHADYYPTNGVRPVKLLAQPDDKFIVVADSNDPDDALWIGRWTADGYGDGTFGAGLGYVELVPPAGETAWRTATLAPDGSIYAVGYHSDGVKASFITARITNKGEVDTTFNAGFGYFVDEGIVSGDSGLTYATTQPDGKLISAGPSNSAAAGGHDAVTLLRRNPDHTLDASFGIGGVVVLPLSSLNDSWPVGLVLMPDRRILVSAEYSPQPMAPYRYAILRFLPSGVLDPSFGSGGVKQLPEISGDIDLRSLALQTDGKMVLAGSGPLPNTTPTFDAFYAVRLLADPPAPPTSPAAPAKLTPTAKISSPKHHRMRAHRLTRFAGSAGPAGQVRRVEIALRRYDTKLLKRHRRCLWLASSKARFTRVKAKRPKGKKHPVCTPTKWRRAHGTRKWSYKLRRRLPRGRYRLYVRVRLLDGTVNTTFTKARGTLRSFTLR